MLGVLKISKKTRSLWPCGFDGDHKWNDVVEKNDAGLLEMMLMGRRVTAYIVCEGVPRIWSTFCNYILQVYCK
jgi:hypothetical protein